MPDLHKEATLHGTSLRALEGFPPSAMPAWRFSHDNEWDRRVRNVFSKLFVRSQAFLQALLAEQTSSQLSRGSRALLSLGFSQADAQRLGHRLSDVGALVYVSCREITKAMGAIELLRSTGAQEAASLNAAKKFSAAA